MSGLQEEKTGLFGVNKNRFRFVKVLISVLKCCFGVLINSVDWKRILAGLLINGGVEFGFEFVDLQM